MSQEKSLKSNPLYTDWIAKPVDVTVQLFALVSSDDSDKLARMRYGLSFLHI